MFKIGDVVRSADGIPMTVEREAHEYEGRAWVPCVWFNGHAELRRGHFEEGSLVKVVAAYGGMVNMRVPKVPVEEGSIGSIGMGGYALEPLPPARDMGNLARKIGRVAAAFHELSAERAKMSQEELARHMREEAKRGPLGDYAPQVFASQLYGAYGEQAAWKNFLGQAMPAWDDLPDHIRDCWEAVARYAIKAIRRR